MDDESVGVPCDIGAEQCAVGAALLDATGRVLAEVLEIAPPETFYRPAHAVILACLRDLSDAGKPFDAVATGAELTKRAEITRVGGAPYLHTLTEAVPTASNGGYYAKIVADRAIQRQLVSTGTRITQIGQAGDGDVEDLIAHAVAAVDELNPGSLAESGVKQWSPGLLELIDALDYGRPAHPVIPVPYGDLAELLGGGFQPGELVTIGALSGHGKTVMALDLARHAAKQGKKVLFHALEMTHEQMQQRAAAAETGISNYRLQPGPEPRTFTDEEMNRLSAYVGLASDMDITVDETSEVGAGLVRARVAAMERAKRLPELVVIDYLQLMETTREDRRDLELGRITRGLKLLAKEKGITVVLLSQIAKDVATRADGRLRLEDFRESAAIGHDSDISIMIENHDKLDPEGERAGTVTLHVVKNRRGASAKIDVASQMHYSRFVDMPRG